MIVRLGLELIEHAPVSSTLAVHFGNLWLDELLKAKLNCLGVLSMSINNV